MTLAGTVHLAPGEAGRYGPDELLQPRQAQPGQHALRHRSSVATYAGLCHSAWCDVCTVSFEHSSRDWLHTMQPGKARDRLEMVRGPSASSLVVSAGTSTATTCALCQTKSLYDLAVWTNGVRKDISSVPCNHLSFIQTAQTYSEWSRSPISQSSPYVFPAFDLDIERNLH